MNVVFNVTASDAQSFRKSEGQIAAMLTRTVGRGRRGCEAVYEHLEMSLTLALSREREGCRLELKERSSPSSRGENAERMRGDEGRGDLAAAHPAFAPLLPAGEKREQADGPTRAFDCV